MKWSSRPTLKPNVKQPPSQNEKVLSISSEIIQKDTYIHTYMHKQMATTCYIIR